MSEEEVDAILAAAAMVMAACAIELDTTDMRLGRPWVGPVTRDRKQHGMYYTVVPNLIVDANVDAIPNDSDLDSDADEPIDEDDVFRNFFRMTK